MALDGGEPLPWIRQALERRYAITPLDAPAPPEGGPDVRAAIECLLIVPPRGFSPADNERPDGRVRAGGRLLHVLDPMLTGRHAVPIGVSCHPTSIGLVPRSRRGGESLCAMTICSPRRRAMARAPLRS